MDHEQKGRLGRWQLYLQQFDFTINYIKGKDNPVADQLSRDKTLIQIGAVQVVVPVQKKVSFKDIDWKKEQQKDPYLVSIYKECKTPFVIDNDILYRLRNDKQKKRIVVPDHLIPKVLELAHDSVLAAHGGVSKTCYHLKGVWFPSFRKEVENYCRTCMVCLKSKGFGEQHNVLSTREPLDILERVYVDIVGPLPNDTNTYKDDARYILTMLDDGSRYLKAVALKGCKRTDITNAFQEHWISTFGIPRVIVSDNNEQFRGEFTDMCKKYDVYKEWTAPYSPEMNAVERVHKTLMNKVRALRHTTNEPWSKCLPLACFSYNISEHSMTGYAPYTLLFGTECDILNNKNVPVSDLTSIRSQATSLAFERRKRAVDKINKHRNDETICTSDSVVVKTIQPGKLDDKVIEKVCKVVSIDAKNVFTLEANNGKTFRRSRKDIRKVSE